MVDLVSRRKSGVGLPVEMKARSLSAAFAVAALAQASGAWAQTRSSTPTAKPSQDDEIVVEAPPSERTSIDRTTYVVRDTAEARSSSTLDLLRQVPTIEVTPRDEIRLLGVSGVKIQIDGKDVADPVTMLRNLQGSQIAKIEVISNPSAQFSAQGTAGIINIVTRRNATSGLRGSATAEAGSFGAYALKLSPSWARGALSLSGSLDASHSSTPAEFERDRRSLGPDGAVTAETIQRRHTRSDSDSVSGNLLVSYKPTKKQTVSVTGYAGRSTGHQSGTSEISLVGDAAAPREQTSAGSFVFDYADISADYKREGPRDGEMLTASAKWSGLHFTSDDRFETDGGQAPSSRFRTRSEDRDSTASLKLDYVRPLGKERRLSFGGTLDRARETNALRQEGETGSGNVLALSSTLRGSWLQEAAYVTYQSRLLGGTMLAGLRVEGRRYRFGGDTPIRGVDLSHFFPSLHLERKLGKKVTADLSYSRRVAWPNDSDLDPVLRFSDPTTASAGNPALRPEITGAFEAKMSARAGRQSIDVTAFLRRTHDSWSYSSDLNGDGVLVTHRINLGSLTSRGASVALRGPIGRRFRYSLNASLAEQDYSQSAFDLSRARTSTHYSGSAQIEYRHGSEGRRGADHVAVNARYYGPTNSVLYRAGAYLSEDASWSHGFTDRLSGILKVQNLTGPFRFRQSYYSPDGIARDSYRIAGPTFKASLTYSLGPPPPAEGSPSK